MKRTKLSVLLMAPTVLAALMAVGGCGLFNRDRDRDDKDRMPDRERRDGDRRDNDRRDEGGGGPRYEEHR